MNQTNFEMNFHQIFWISFNFLNQSNCYNRIELKVSKLKRGQSGAKLVQNWTKGVIRRATFRQSLAKCVKMEDKGVKVRLNVARGVIMRLKGYKIGLSV